VAALFLSVAGTGAYLYFRHEARQPEAIVESRPVKEQLSGPADGQKSLPKKESPSNPKGAPSASIPTLLPEPTAPRELSGDEVYRQLLRSTAFIVTPRGFGSGVLVDTKRRLVLTNAHVAQDYKKVAILFPVYDRDKQVITDFKYYEGRANEAGFPAEVLTRSISQDLALLQLDRLPSDVRPIGFSKQPASTGVTVYSIGGSGINNEVLWRLSTGTVRGRAKQEYRDSQGVRNAMVLETQSPVNPGDSGGPVVNARVELVGIVAAFDRRERLVSLNIDVAEARDFIGDYFRTQGESWKEPESQSLVPAVATASVLDNLIAVLKAGVPADRIAAARRLGKLRAQARAAVPALLSALETTDEEFQIAVGAALNLIGPPETGSEKVLIQALLSKSPVARTYAAKMLATEVPLSTSGVKSVTTALREESPEIRAHLLRAIEKVGAKARPVALGPLLERLADADQSVREAAAAGIKALGPPEREDRAVLLGLMKHADIRVRVAAVNLLRPLATTRDDVLSIWLPLLKDADSQLRLASVTALSASGELLSSAAKDFVPLLADPEPTIRRSVAHAARNLKDESGLADQLATRLESESDATVKAALAESLIALTPADAKAVPLLRRFLTDQSPEVREQAAKRIAILAADAAPAIPDLMSLIADKTEGVRVAALLALATMGERAKDAIPATADLFDKPLSEPVLLAATQLLGETGRNGIKRLETVCQKQLPESVRAAMCKVFAKADSVSETTRTWMIDQAESITGCRESVSAVLVKKFSKVEVQELLRRTLPYKTRTPGEKAVKYDVDYRVWAIVTLRKLDYSGSALRESRQMVIERLNLLVMSNTDAEVVAEAKAALAELKK